MIYTYQGGTGRCLSPLSAVGKENMEEQKYEAYEDRFKEYTEFYACIRDLVEHPAVQSMKKYPHHADITCFEHCMNVAYYNYEICRILGLNAKAAARGGILHDLFLYDWHTHAKRTGEHFHGLTHPKVALLNASRYFDLTPLEKDIILKHMWPLTLMPPRYPESFQITLTDKYSGAREVAEYYAGKVNPGRLKLPFGYRGIQLLARKWVRDAKREGVLEEDTPSDKQS